VAAISSRVWRFCGRAVPPRHEGAWWLTAGQNTVVVVVTDRGAVTQDGPS
jgi:hypothetical protein